MRLQWQNCERNEQPGQACKPGKSYRQQVDTAQSLEDLSGIAYNAEGPGSSSHSPCYDLTKAMLNKATNLMSKMPEFQHLTVNAGDPGWCRYVLLSRQHLSFKVQSSHKLSHRPCRRSWLLEG